MTDTCSEKHRHECEVRYVMNMRGTDARKEFLLGVEKKRGKASADKLRADIQAQWNERLQGRAAA